MQKTYNMKDDYKFTIAEDVVCQIAIKLYFYADYYSHMFGIHGKFKVCVLCGGEKDKEFMQHWLCRILYQHYRDEFPEGIMLNNLFIFATSEADLLGHNFFHIYMSKSFLYKMYGINDGVLNLKLNDLAYSAAWRSRARTGVSKGLPIYIAGEVDYTDE